ncbi:MAG: ChaN family lipoprotein [Roseovarius sp.]
MRLAALLACLAMPALAQPDADIVVLGEVHDNADAHLGQAAMLDALQPTAVVFEMLSPEDARRIDAERHLAEVIWDAGNWPDYALYAPIFDASGSARIIGAAAPRESVRSVYGDGPATLFGPDAARFGLDQPLPDDQQTAREALQFAAHCEAMPLEMMPGMVDVQRYRDAVFARAALEALETYGPPVAVIAGNGHARTDWGVPAMIAKAAPGVTTHAIAFTEEQTDIPYDETRVVPPAERDDPCSALKTN